MNLENLILKAAKELCNPNNTVTNLEIKNYLIKNFSVYRWTQKHISDTMMKFENEGKFTFTDNGTYRTYSLTKTKNNVMSNTRISKKKALELMSSSKGRFFTVFYKKQKGEDRVMNCQYMKDQGNDTALGYVRVKEAVKMKNTPDDCIRRVNIQTLKSLVIGGVNYKVG